MPTIADLKPDPRNTRKHTPRNVATIVNALNEVGAARSIVVDEDNVILAGNATIEAAAEAGIERVRIVDADGEEIIAVRRSNLTPEQKTRLALFDNRSAELAEWDADVLRGLADEVDLSAFWYEPELDRILIDLSDAESFDPAAEWRGMPEYENEDQRPVKQIAVSFASVEDMERFSRLIEQKVTLETRSVWYPARNLESIRDKAYVAAAD